MLWGQEVGRIQARKTGGFLLIGPSREGAGALWSEATRPISRPQVSERSQ